MPTTLFRNRVGELWDPVSGFVYDEDGSVLRAGHGTNPLTKAAAADQADDALPYSRRHEVE